ncbi:hypothetical protein C8F04DRAFT_1179257 [Mycena alexandri]|uniref:HTH CENPB-type domain-containing protein n=1 Tax=Mycena alexandri TaxID=1745969 RepID=A0AAD6T4Z3_9AGAR|nr:hypothetical protein C8F04DRAFT_1179257 [Mycena alexandri]
MSVCGHFKPYLRRAKISGQYRRAASGWAKNGDATNMINELLSSKKKCPTQTSSDDRMDKLLADALKSEDGSMPALTDSSGVNFYEPIYLTEEEIVEKMGYIVEWAQSALFGPAILAPFVFMPPRKPKTAQSKAEDAAREAWTQEAITAVAASGLTPSGRPVFSLRAAAKQYNISSTTLTARWNSRTTRVESHVERQKLSPAQELVLKEWIKVMGVRGVPLTMTAVAEYASVIVGEEKITKYNLPTYYHTAREKAMTPKTIQSAFRSCGIFPFNRNIIEDDADKL